MNQWSIGGAVRAGGVLPACKGAAWCSTMCQPYEFKDSHKFCMSLPVEAEMKGVPEDCVKP